MIPRSIFAAAVTTLFTLAFFVEADVARAHEDVLIIQVRSDLEPYVEFDTVEVQVTGEFTPPTTITRYTPASVGDFGRGVRVFEEEVDSGTYRAVMRATLAGVVVVERTLRFEMAGHFHWAWGEHADFDLPELRVLTVLLSVEREPVHAVETMALELDVDGDGAPGCGDVVRFQVKANGDDLKLGSVFQQVLPPGTVLIPGSVVTSHGDVVKGNPPADPKAANLSSADNHVLIDFGSVPSNEGVEVHFDALVAPVIRTQGVVGIEVDEDFGYGVFTDDPQTQDLDEDESVLGLVCSAPAQPDCEALPLCQDDLAACSDGAAATLAALATCEADREAMKADADADLVPASLDACPGTSPPGVAVDTAGCSQAQFCAAITVSGFGDALTCLAADWRNDEPLGFPGDCTPNIFAHTCSAP